MSASPNLRSCNRLNAEMTPSGGQVKIRPGRPRGGAEGNIRSSKS